LRSVINARRGYGSVLAECGCARTQPVRRVRPPSRAPQGVRTAPAPATASNSRTGRPTSAGRAGLEFVRPSCDACVALAFQLQARGTTVQIQAPSTNTSPPSWRSPRPTDAPRYFSILLKPEMQGRKTRSRRHRRRRAHPGDCNHGSVLQWPVSCTQRPQRIERRWRCGSSR
jgi:hypothetical protein